MTTYFAADIPVHVQAIGGAAVRMTLDAIADARRITKETVEATIAHMDFVSEDDVPRLQRSMSPPKPPSNGQHRSSYLLICWYEQGQAGFPNSIIDGRRANQTLARMASVRLSTYKPLELLEAAVTAQVAR